MEKIDNLDKKILEIITGNARIPFKDVAAECGVVKVIFAVLPAKNSSPATKAE